MNSLPVIILGCGGHATVIAEILLQLQKPILGYIALQPTKIKGYPDIDYLGTDADIDKFASQKIRLVNGIGAISVQKNILRRNIYEQYKMLGFEFETLIHPSASVASTAILKEGAQVMAGSIVQSNAIIESNAIVNTGARVDHDCCIGHSVHVAPGVTLSGNVVVGENVHIGVGSIVIQGITIEKNAMICAGSRVIKNVLPEHKVKDVF